MKEISDERFRHGDSYSRLKNSGKEVMDFSASIGQNSGLSGIQIFPEELIHYPSSQDEISSIISNVSGFVQEMITAGYGLTSLIYAVYSIFTNGSALIAEPLFSEHRRAAMLRNMSIVRVPLHVIIKHPEILKNYSVDIVSINSPVNPTGEYLSEDTVTGILDQLSSNGVYLFLDEAFIDFVPLEKRINLKILLDRYPNLIVGRSFSKISGLAGLRLGYTISSPEMAERIKSNLIPWTVPLFYSRILPDLLSTKVDPGLVAKEREYVSGKIREAGCTILGKPEANYISFRIPSLIDGKNFVEKMLNKGFLIRSISNFHGFTESDFRIAILDRESNEKLIAAISGEINDAR
ncbi:MAG: aminotransferase class I/II-fold pyridoxal phosphate-dependent enzyme [Candidatus Thermoplasmatota archaeon]|nr:aminotransferase class I/II-fold pyridoxal phosphate-dependent enzyme [Candidatus Thermoplasmatota archaeon]